MELWSTLVSNVAKGEDVNVMPTQNPCVLTPQPKYVFVLFYVSRAQRPKAGVRSCRETEKSSIFINLSPHASIAIILIAQGTSILPVSAVEQKSVCLAINGFTNQTRHSTGSWTATDRHIPPTVCHEQQRLLTQNPRPFIKKVHMK